MPSSWRVEGRSAPKRDSDHDRSYTAPFELRSGYLMTFSAFLKPKATSWAARRCHKSACSPGEKVEQKSAKRLSTGGVEHLRGVEASRVMSVT
jgi:hypothetical protein